MNQQIDQILPFILPMLPIMILLIFIEQMIKANIKIVESQKFVILEDYTPEYTEPMPQYIPEYGVVFDDKR